MRPSFLVSAFFAAALLLRLAPFTAATTGGLRLLSPDCYGHLRRAASVARNFPHVPVFDPWLNHPDGAVFIWPPLFDLLVGGLARLIFGRTVTTDQVGWVAASLPPLLGALHVFPLFALCRRLFGPRRALLAAGAYALLPTAAIWSSFGHADHHVLEVLVLLLFLDAAVAAARAPDGRRGRQALLAGALLGVSFLTWQGAVLFAGLAFPWALVCLGPAAPLLGAAAFAVAASGTAVTLAGEQVPFSFISFGWFQPALLAAGTIPLAVWGALRSKGTQRAAFVLLAGALLLFTIPSSTPLLKTLTRGTAHLVNREADLGPDFDGRGYLSYPASFFKLVAELQPLVSRPWLPGIARATEELSAGLLFLPFALVLWSVPLLDSRPPRNRDRSPRLRARSLVVLFAGVLLLMTLTQRRNSYYLGVFTAIALSEGVARISDRLKVRSEVPPLVFAACLVLVPGIRPLRTMASYREAPGPDFLELLRRFAKAAPVGIDPSALPPPAPGSIEGVFGPWAAGHFVTALTGRPAAADPNTYGFIRQCRFFTATDDAEPLAILRETKCRYLLTANLRGVLATYAWAAGRPAGIPVDGMFATRIHESASSRPVPYLELLMESRTGTRAPGGRIVPNFRIWKVISPAQGGGAPAPARAAPGAASGG
ncbi:MAG TPA: STT3 domain-containing protein [Thermoanaerobaculia bacterium]